MINPKGYIEEFKNKPYDELVKEKNYLVGEILKFENGVGLNGERIIHPSPEVVYQCNLGYLSELCKLIVEKYQREYVWADFYTDEDE